MKLTIKTLDQKTFHVDFDDTRTVWDLKAHLFRLPEIGVQPEQQQLIYAGRVLVNEDVLKKYSIDERKFLVVMAKKPVAPSPVVVEAPPPTPTSTSTSAPTPSPSHSQNNSPIPIMMERPPERRETTRHVQPTRTSTESVLRRIEDITPLQPIRPGPSQNSNANSVPLLAPTPIRQTMTDVSAMAAANLTATDVGLRSRRESRSLLQVLNQQPTASCNESLVRDIMNMGYAEADVRRALIASFNNADRAIEYLIEGIPEFPEMLTPQTSEQRRDGYNPLHFLRDDPRFNQMRRVIQQRPELLSMVLSKIGETNPALLAVIREHQDEFLRMLNDSEENSEPDDYSEDVVEVVLSEEERLAVDRLVGLGFPRDMVVQAYIACEKNEEQTADFLCRHMEDN